MADGKVEYTVGADTSSYDKDLEQLKKTAESAGNSAAAAVDKSADKAEKSVKDSAGAAEKATKQASENSAASAEKGSQIITKAYKTAIATIGAAASAVIATGVKFNAEVETYQTSFEVMLGSAEEAVALTQKLVDLGAATPFRTADLADATQLLINYGLSAEDAYDSMTMLGDIAQGSAEKLGSIALAYGQMSSLGKVQLQDIKQMINAGFNPLQEIAETTGESMESLYDRISKGTISVDEITAAMQRSTSAGGKYFQSMEKQSKTVSGQWSTLKDNFEEASGKIVDGISDWLADDALPAVNDAVQWLGDNFQTLIPIVGAATVAATAFVVAVNWSKIVKSATDAIKALNLALDANPVMFVVAGIASLIAGLSALSQIIHDNNTYLVEQEAVLDDNAEALEAVNAAVEDNNKAYEEQMGSIEATVTLADMWITRLEELESKTSLTRDEQYEWNVLLNNLESAIPGVTDLVNEQTGEINGGTAALRKYIDQWKQTAVAKVYAERAEQAVEDLVDAEIALDDVKMDISNTTKDYNDALALQTSTMEKAKEVTGSWVDDIDSMIYILREQISAGKDTDGTMQGLLDTLNDCDNVMRVSNDTLGTLNEQLVTAQGEYDAATENVDKFGLKSAEAAEEINNTTESLQKQAEEALPYYAQKLNMTTDEYEDAINRRVEVTQNAFEKIEEAEAVSLDAMIDNLQSNQVLVEEWTQNLGILTERGLDNGLLRVLEEAGPEAAGTVRNLVNASDEELKALNNVFEAGSEEAVQTLLETMNLPDTTNAGADAVDNAAEGMEENDALIETAEATVTDTKEAMVNAVRLANFDEVGKQIVSGMTAGMTSKSGELYSRVSKIVSNAISKAKAAAAVASPSKKTTEIFEYVGEGMIVGLEHKRKKLLDTAEDITATTIAELTPNITNISNAVSTSYNTSTTLNNIAAAEQTARMTAAGNAPVYLYLDGNLCGSTLAPYMSYSLEQLRVQESRGG